jgi:hypothetical protein
MADSPGPEAGDVDFDENQNLVVYDGERWAPCPDDAVADIRTRSRNDPTEVHVLD